MESGFTLALPCDKIIKPGIKRDCIYVKPGSRRIRSNYGHAWREGQMQEPTIQVEKLTRHFKVPIREAGLKAATRSLLHSKFMRERTNVKCVYVQELPLHDKQEPIIDCRTAPGT